MQIVSLLVSGAEKLIGRTIYFEVLLREEYVLIEREHSLHPNAEGPIGWTLTNMSQSLGNGAVKNDREIAGQFLGLFEEESLRKLHFPKRFWMMSGLLLLVLRTH